MRKALWRQHSEMFWFSDGILRNIAFAIIDILVNNLQMICNTLEKSKIFDKNKTEQSKRIHN